MEMEFRMFFRFNQCIGNLDKKRFQITADTGEPFGSYPAIALVVAWAAASLGNKML